MKCSKESIVYIKDIRIPEAFKRTTPSPAKMEDKLNAFYKTGVLSPVIIYKTSFVLIDGYMQYLIAKDLGIRQIFACIIDDRTASQKKVSIKGINRTRRFGSAIECYICGRQLTDSIRTLDHIVPRAKGGISEDTNLGYCCRKCNQLKGQFDLTDDLVRAIKRERDLYG